MVDLNAVGGVFTTIALVLAVFVVLLAVVGGLVWYWLRERKFGQFECRILVLDKKSGLVTNGWKDKAGIFVDKKTNNKRFYMKKGNVGLSPDDVPFIPEESKGLIGGMRTKKVVYLVQTGLKNFHIIRMKAEYPSVTLSVTEEDVNWGVNAYDRFKKTFQASLLMQILPYVGFIIMAAFVLVLIIYVLRKFDVIADAAVALENAAESIREAAVGTRIIE